MLRDRSIWTVAALVLLALAVRLAWSAWTQPVTPTLSDPEYYHATALSLVHGDGYGVTFTDHGFFSGGDATALWPPGYSAYLAPAFAVVGDRLWSAWLMNALAGAATIVPIYFVSRRLFSSTAGIVAGAIAALLPSFVFWTPVLFSDTLFTLLFACALALALYTTEGSRVRPALAIATAMFIGLSVFVRGQALILVPISAAWWLIEGVRPARAALWSGAMVGIVALIATPWAIRNARSMDSPIVLSANFGYNLRVGHAPYSTGGYLLPDDLWNVDPGISFRERETVFNQLGTRRSVRYAVTHPGRELALSVHKTVRLWRPDAGAINWVTSFGKTPLPSGAAGPLRLLVEVTYLLVLALAGLAFLRRQEIGKALWLLAFAITARTSLHVIFFGEPRFHLPMLVLLVPAAASTIVWTFDQARSLTQRSSACP